MRETKSKQLNYNYMDGEWYIVEKEPSWGDEKEYELMKKENIAFRFDNEMNPRFWKVVGIQEMQFEASIKEKTN